MKEMSVEGMKEYLLKAINLEKSIMEQEKIIEKSNLKNEIRDLRRERGRSVSERDRWKDAAPENTESIPEPELCSEARGSLFGSGIFTISWIFYIVGVVFYFCTKSLEYVRTFTLIASLGFVGIGAIIDIKHFVEWLTWPSTARKINERKLALYKKEKEEQEKKHKEAVERIESNRKELLPKINKNVARLGKEIDDAEGKLSDLKGSLEKTKETLAKLYNDVSVLHPKYQNFAAVCQIYEYLDTGRCTELTGASGAYNLYESELRQNLIIISLVVVIKQLEDIRANQYMLYTQMQSINHTLSAMSADIYAISNATKSIQQNTALSAYYGAIAAQNTETLKYIALVK